MTREEAILRIKDHMEVHKYCEVANAIKICEALGIAIEALRQPEQRWIPVSERLPKIGKEVLLSEPNAMFIAVYCGSGNPEGLWLVDGYHHFLADVNGCAWMPRPEPYREEGEWNG